MEIDLRPATLDDADAVAELETARTPDDPHDGEMVRYWWTHAPDGKRAMRLLGDGVYVSVRHADWKEGERRFGMVHVVVMPSIWSSPLFRRCLSAAESWLADESADVSVIRVRDDFDDELRAAADHGYGKVRAERFWELDLLPNREQLLATLQLTRERMRTQGIELTTLAEDDSPETLKKTHELDVESTMDIPKTVPFTMPPFEEWWSNYLDNPAVRKDRFWIARIGDEVVGMSLIEYPPGRGVPHTQFTGTARRHRGRGIARALKYETIAQAIAVGATHVRTDNDSENAPILHINAEMGYRPMTPVIELHRDL